MQVLPGGAGQTSLIGWSVAATVVIFLLSWAVGLLTAYANISLGQRMVYDLAGDLFAKLQQLSLRFHSSKSVGDNIRRVTSDCTCISVIVKDAVLPVFGSVVSLVAFFTVLWRFDAALTLLALAVVPYMMLVFWFYAEPMMERSYQQQEIEGKIYDLVEQTFTAIPAVQAFGREKFNDQQFARRAGETIAATVSLTNLQVQFKILMGLATAVGTAAILWLGATHVIAGTLSLGAIVAFISYLGSLYAPLEAIMYTNAIIQGAAGSARRVQEVLGTEDDVSDKPGARSLTAVQGHVQIENVTFGYKSGQPVLRDVSLEARPGETVALVGATGAGKSTLAGLIPRFFDPWEGQLLLDGQDLRELRVKSLRGHVSIVLQDAFLFPMSIAENIAYGRPEATQAEVEAAARTANAHEFIQKLPDGYATTIGERGATLSGGERQRISIARALLKNAPILILDEPTSALDVETEGSLVKALEQLAKGRTTFIIAHRLSTIRRADRIAVLDGGRLVEIGTHDELIKRGAIYARYHELQFGASSVKPEAIR
jgi:ATP-binding cassette subfamily B protein/subfamily B ATP-binding cassette protein MsbA